MFKITLGAAGGLLSRLRKVMSLKKINFDYGVSWSTLFLTPVVGALTGWVGVLLVPVLVKMNVLGAFFDIYSPLTWDEAQSKPETIALAVIFGYSATFFDRIMEKVEGKLIEGPPSGNSS